ncbi:MAG: hypothetical protein V1897_12485 [Pseudomonadota bacterium]
MITNIHKIPEIFLRALERDDYNDGGVDISVTRLIQPPKLVALQELHRNELSQDLGSKIWLILGKTLHKILEECSEETAIVEQRFFTERHEYKISGAFDKYDPKTRTITDYKFTTAYGAMNGGRSEWVSQLNLLALLARENDLPVENLNLCLVLRDWSQTQFERSKDYPPAPILQLPVELWSEEKAEEYLDTRVRLHQAARIHLLEGQDNLYDCSPQERWQTPDVFAVMKPGRKTAVRLHDTECAAKAYAETAGPDHYVDHRPGKSIRCESYCPCQKVCDQGRALQAQAK